jgi:hemolysin III
MQPYLVKEASLKLQIREPVNAISHFASAVAALLGSLVLIIRNGRSTTEAIALTIYGVSLVCMFGASGIYHSVSTNFSRTVILRKIDHSAIYFLIAGTYTPFCMIAFTGFWRWGFLAIIWSMALAGIVGKVFIINSPRWFTAGVYVAMGWLSIFAVGELLQRLSAQSLGWLIAGGLLYTFGAVIYITKKGNFFPGVFGFHEVWHIFVMLGAMAHFLAIATLI